MREDLANPETSGAGLATDAKAAHELAAKLKESNPELAAEIEAMASSMDDAAKAKSESDALAKHNEATEDLKDAAAAGSEVADVLSKDPALAEDAKTVAEISKVVEEMGNGGKVDGETLDKAITDTKAEIAKLRATGHPEEAAKLEEMLTKLEEAKA